MKILQCGHEIGLHFDETAYGSLNEKSCVEKILREKDMLSELLGTEITTVSMHRPSQRVLESDWQIPGMINSYGEMFFQKFKYLSDSRRHWREPVLELIESEKYEKLHILTHPIWYRKESGTIKDSLSQFICSAKKERYDQLKENISDLDSVLKREEV